MGSPQADIGVKNGKIAGIGKAGNPDIMDGVTEGMVAGSSTEAKLFIAALAGLIIRAI